MLYDPVMGCTQRRGSLLDLWQPMQSFRGSELDAGCLALSTVDRLHRLAPAQAARQLYREHANFPPSFQLQQYMTGYRTTPPHLVTAQPCLLRKRAAGRAHGHSSKPPLKSIEMERGEAHRRGMLPMSGPTLSSRRTDRQKRGSSSPARSPTRQGRWAADHRELSCRPSVLKSRWIFVPVACVLGCKQPRESRLCTPIQRQSNLLKR